MRPRRLILALLLAVGLAPGIVVRAPPVVISQIVPIRIHAMSLAPSRVGAITLEAGWVLHSPSSLFGGYSALIDRRDGTLISVSDGGRLMTVRLEDEVPVGAYQDKFMRRGGPEEKFNFDLEAATRDPDSGAIWMATEQTNSIERFDPEFNRQRRVRPAAMKSWSANSGPEAMVRLSDGRFVVLQEARRNWFGEAHRGLLFARDPIAGSPAPREFAFEGPAGFAPVDMTQLPDGRVLILLRRLVFPFPPRFASAIAIADPAEIRPDAVWRARLLVRFPASWPQENYEGLAAAPLADGGVRLWVISDDNNMQRLQQTKLLRLRLDPAAIAGGQAKGARSPAARP